MKVKIGHNYILNDKTYAVLGVTKTNILVLEDIDGDVEVFSCLSQHQVDRMVLIKEPNADYHNKEYEICIVN